VPGGCQLARGSGSRASSAALSTGRTSATAPAGRRRRRVTSSTHRTTPRNEPRLARESHDRQTASGPLPTFKAWYGVWDEWTPRADVPRDA